MLRFISKLNDDLKEQLFILCSAISRYLAKITAHLMLRNVVSNSFQISLGKNLTFGAPIEIYRRRRRVEFIGSGVPAAAPTSVLLIAPYAPSVGQYDLSSFSFLICMGLVREVGPGWQHFQPGQHCQTIITNTIQIPCKISDP